MITIRTKTLCILAILATMLGTSYASASPEAAPLVGQPMVAVQVRPVHPSSVPATFSTTFKRIGNLATFDVLSSSSIVELNFNGRIFVTNFNIGSDGAYFELRVDDLPSPHDYARDFVGVAEVATDIHSSITGIFTSLSPGTHTASMWVQGLSEGGTFPIVNPNDLDSDHLVIKEYTPFGYTYLPVVRK